LWPPYGSSRTCSCSFSLCPDCGDPPRPRSARTSDWASAGLWPLSVCCCSRPWRLRP
jgi:hypothetical protein